METVSLPATGPSEQPAGVMPPSSGAPPPNPSGTAGPSSNAAAQPIRPQMPQTLPPLSPTRPPRPAVVLPPLSGPYSPARPTLLPGPTQRPLTSQAPNQHMRPLMSPPARRRAQRPSSGALKKHCNCKNSRCLKLYCECFASGRYCDSCNCVNCCNNHEHETTRQAAVEGILERNPNAFRPKIQATDDVSASVQARHNKGCNCKKSGCLKKYCECFQAGIVCSDICKCVDCKNFEGSEARAAIMYTQEASRAQPMSPAAKRFRSAPRVYSPSQFSPAASPTQPGLMAAPGSYGGPPRPPSSGAYRPALGQGAVTAATIAYRNQFSEALRRGVAEEVCRLLLIVSQEEGALVARQQPPAQQQAPPDGGTNSGVPAAALAVVPGGAGHAVAAAAQPSQPAPLPTAPVTLQNGPGHAGPPQLSPTQPMGPGQPPVSSAATPASSTALAASPVPAVPSLPAIAASLPPGVSANGAYARAVHAASQQEAANLYAAQERAVLKEYHVILKKIMAQVQTRAALQMQSAAQPGAAAAVGYRPPSMMPGGLPAMQPHQQQLLQQNLLQQHFQQQQGVRGVGLPATSSATVAASVGMTTPTGPYPMQAEFPMVSGGYSPGPHAGSPSPAAPLMPGAQIEGPGSLPAAAQPLAQMAEETPMVTFKEEPTASSAGH